MGLFYKLKSNFSKELCPYCFEYFELKDAPFRCSNPNCKVEPDPIYEKYWGSKPLKHLIKSEVTFFGGMKKSVKCDLCKEITYKKVCPNCHQTLPTTIGEYKNHIFAVIGGPDSGKSHYIAVLINQLMNEVGPKMGFMLDALDDDTRIKYRVDFYKPLFENHTILNKTLSGNTNKNTKKPLIYGISILKNNKITDYLTLVFFDTAGEDLNKEDTMSIVNKYIYRSDGIILLIDPLQMVNIRNKLIGVPMPSTISSQNQEILSRTTHLIKKANNLKPTDKVDIPLAVAFTKIDAIESLLDGDYQLKHNSNHNKNKIDIDDIEALSSEIKALLVEWGEGNIVNFVETQYKKSKFFGLSALGTNPHNTKKVDKILPRRVEDPFLWLLYENGILK